MVKLRAKRHRTSFGPFRINRTGLRVTSVTMSVLAWNVVLWERKR